jgi:hypothetical protein
MQLTRNKYCCVMRVSIHSYNEMIEQVVSSSYFQSSMLFLFVLNLIYFLGRTRTSTGSLA